MSATSNELETSTLVQARESLTEETTWQSPAKVDFDDYSVSVEEIRLLLFENGIEKSKDTIQRYLRTDAVELDAADLDEPASTGVQEHEGADGDAAPELQVHAGAEPSKSLPESEPYEAAPTRMQAHAEARGGEMVEFLKGQINVKDEQIKVKDNQIAAMLERDRETNFLIRELQTQLSNTFRLVAGGEGSGREEGRRYREPEGRPADVHNSVENPVGQSPLQ
jgi:hypothetical protein